MPDTIARQQESTAFPTINGKRWLSTAEAGKVYSLSPDMLRRAIAAGELVAYPQGKAHRIFVEDLEAFLRRAPLVPRRPSTLAH